MSDSRIQRDQFLFKIFMIFYLRDLEDLNAKDISFIVNEKSKMVNAYCDIYKCESLEGRHDD